MINLLPDERKQNIRAGRMNVLLLRYNMFTLAAIAAMAVVCLGFYFILQSERSNALSTNSTNTRQESALANVKRAASDYRTNLNGAKQILNNSTSYTDVIVAITKLVPSGVVLDSLDLTSSSFGQQDTFSAHATTYAAALQLKQNFQSSKLFSNVFFQTLTNANAVNTTAASTPEKYPITVSISALLAKAQAS
jgi:hypothetical protein